MSTHTAWAVDFARFTALFYIIALLLPNYHFFVVSLLRNSIEQQNEQQKIQAVWKNSQKSLSACVGVK